MAWITQKPQKLREVTPEGSIASHQWGIGNSYTIGVVDGDTLRSVAQQLRASADDLYAQNMDRIKPDRMLTPGQTLEYTEPSRRVQADVAARGSGMMSTS